MGAFLAAIGGAGNAASRYGEQVRGILEQRRGTFADMIGKAAADESDPTTRAALLQHSADLLSGKPIGKIAANFYKTMEKRHADNQHLQGVIGQPPAPPPNPPGPAAGGQTPGTVGGVPSGGSSPGPAAQPSMSLIQPEAIQAPERAPAPPQAIPQQAAPPPEIPPVAAAPAAIPPVAAAPTGPQFQDPNAIMMETLNNPLWTAPANRPALLQAAQQRISHNEQLRSQIEGKQFELENKRAALTALKASPGWAAMSPIMKAQYEAWAAAPGGQVPTMAAGLMRPQTSRVRAEDMSAEQKALHGIPADAKGPYWIYNDVLTGQPARAAEPAAITYEQVAGPNGLENVQRLLGGVTTAGGSPALPPSALNLRGVGVDSSGHTQFNDAFGIRNGTAPVAGGGVSPSFIPSVTSSTKVVPGQPTETSTSVRTKGAGGKAGIPSVSSGAGGGEDAVTKQAYDSWVSGGPVPTGKTLNAVRAYQQKHGLPDPTTISATGQKSLAAIDPVMDEITRTKQMLEAAIKKGVTQIDLTKDWAKYKLHQDSENTALISNLSFAALRSAVSALANSGSRAYPVLKMALEHTPSALGDPNRSLKLLNEMETRVKEAREAVLRDEKKSGIVPAIPGAPTNEDPLGVLH